MFSDRTNWKLAPNRLTEALEQVRARSAKILDLSASNPTRVELRYHDQAILAALTSPHALDYDPQAKGLRVAREAVSSYYLEDHGIADLDPERIILTSSTSEGYSYVFRLLCNAGDELLVPKPSYPLFEFLADLQDVKLVPYPLIYDHGWQMDFPSIEKAVTARTRAVIVVHPNNPTGSYVHGEDLVQLNRFCREHALALIVDEVFLDYRLEVGSASGAKAQIEEEHYGSGISAAPPKGALAQGSFAGNSEVLTFTLSGLSKISALPQMKVAWVITTGPQSEVAAATARLEIIADTYLSMNAPIQHAVPALLNERKNIQPQLLKRIQKNLSEIDRRLAGQKSCQRLTVEGGWYVVLRVPVTQSDEDLAIELVREKSVMVHPSHFYDFPRDGYLILSLITPEQDFAEGICRAMEHLNP